MFGCENFLNLWAPATLIAGGMMAQGFIGNLRTLKFFGLCFGASYGFMSAFGPSNGTSFDYALTLFCKQILIKSQYTKSIDLMDIDILSSVNQVESHTLSKCTEQSIEV